MSIKVNRQNTAAAGAAPDTAPLTPEQVVEQLRALRDRIPEFVQLPKGRQMYQLRRVASVSVPFAREAFNTIGASETVQNVIGNTPDELHQADDETARWTAVETELRAMLRGVIAANLVRRQRIGQVALQAYNVSSQLVKSEEHAHLLPHVERMRRIPKFGQRRAKPAAEALPVKPADAASK